MPSATIKIAEFKPAHQNDRGKTIPPKIVDGNGSDYVVPRELVEIVQAFTGKTVEIEFTERQNGKWTNRDLVSAVLPEPRITTVPAGNGWGKSPDEAARICRQNALTNAVAYWGSSATLAKILDTAQLFSKWNLDGIVQTIEVPVAPSMPIAEQKAQPRRYTTGLREGEDLVTAARRAVEEHDQFEDELAKIPPADASEFEGPAVRHPIPAARETLRASGPARR